MKKSKYKCRYDDKTGMTLLRASIGYCIVAAVIINVALAKSLSQDAVAGLMVGAGFFPALDLFVRITHFKARRKSEKLMTEDDEIRYISPTEKITYWALKLVIPFYLVALLVAATLLGI
ncbi:MAG: hypothetical protein K2G44_04925 [Clostridia bacterium]|nr:hypothetical protein [Clostridia bacterium]